MPVQLAGSMCWAMHEHAHQSLGLVQRLAHQSSIPPKTQLTSAHSTTFAAVALTPVVHVRRRSARGTGSACAGCFLRALSYHPYSL